MQNLYAETEKCWWRKLKKFYTNGKAYCAYESKDHVVKVSCVHAQPLQTFCDPVDVAHQALLSMGFSSQEYWSGLPCFPSGDLPILGIEPSSHTSPKLARTLEWVAFPFSRGSSQARDQTQVSRIAGDSLPAEPRGWPPELAGGCFPTSTTWEAQ